MQALLTKLKFQTPKFTFSINQGDINKREKLNSYMF
jgi:hypothetical protein